MSVAYRGFVWITVAGLLRHHTGFPLAESDYFIVFGLYYSGAKN